ncbi:MAG: hypothetical protein ACE5KZ_00260 [Candidatus Scalinduaceae bacterium]
MIKKHLKYWHVFTTVIIALGLFNAGCSKFQFKRFTFGKQKRINILEKKVDVLSNSMESLNAKNSELKKKFSELKLEKERLNKEYAKMENKQVSIETTLELRNDEHANLQKELLETRNLLREIRQKLVLVETDKNEIKAQLEELESLYSKPTKVETSVARTTNIGKKTNDTEKSRESLIKETKEKRVTSLVEDLLDKAIQFYRQGKYEEAISKWEEVLALDPSKLEAKFNIEIAQDRIKEKEIQKELKSSLIQRK